MSFRKPWDKRPNPVIACTAAEDKARQEFKDESDLLFQIKRYGAGVPFQSGYVDYTLDLMRANEVIAEAADAWNRLPKIVRDTYKDWGEVEAAGQDGSLLELLKPPAAAEVPSAAGGGSASDSAPAGP